MPEIFWLSVCAGYCLWAAKGRRGTLLQGAWNGFFLGLLCFGALPAVMGRSFSSGIAAVCGAAAGVWLEGRSGRRFFPFAALLFAVLTVSWLWQGDTGTSLQSFLSFLGGMGLYAACCGILPEGGAGEKLRPAVGGGIGFLLSTVIFAAMGIF